MKDSKNQFCLSRAAQSASGAPKSQFPSVPMSKLSARSIGLACLFATVVLVLTGSVSRANVLVAFDDLGLLPLDDVTNQYASSGVIFQGFTDAGGLTNIEVAGNSVFSDLHPPSPPYCLSNFYNHNSGQRARVMRILFTTPVSSISFMYDGAGSLGATTTFNVYSPAGVLLNSFHVATATDNAYHSVNVPDVNVGYLDIVNPQAGWGHYIDNLQFLCTGPPALSIQPAAAIRWPSVLNTPYQVQWAPRVNTNIWYNLGPPVKGSGACLTAYDMVDGGARFYRVVVNPNPAKSSLSPVLVSSGSSTSGSGETTNGGISSQPTPAPSLPLAFVPATSSPATASGEKTNRED